MIFYSSEARKTAIDRINELQVKLSEIPLSDKFNLDDVGNLHMYLSFLQKEIIYEDKKDNLKNHGFSSL